MEIKYVVLVLPQSSCLWR